MKYIIILLHLLYIIHTQCPEDKIKVLCESNNDYICCDKPTINAKLMCDKRISNGCIFMKEALDMKECTSGNGVAVSCPILFRAFPMNICCENMPGYEIRCQSLLCLYFEKNSTVNDNILYLN
jgi:hypothetical protein